MQLQYRRLVILMALGLGLAATLSPANNLTLSNIQVSGRSASTAYVTFDISWENSWRYTNLNHDAAWVFFKVLAQGSNAWEHVTLEGSGINPTDYLIGTGTALELVVPDDRVGVFVRRAGEGSGMLSAQNVKVVWNIASNGLARTSLVRMQAMALEMVYVAGGTNTVGSSGTEDSRFYAGGLTTNDSFEITSEAALALTNSIGNLTFVGGSGSNTIPADFPKGYAPFYCMKYEVSQGQYRDFLNQLTRTQQTAHAASQANDDFALSATATIAFRNGIRCPSSVPAEPEVIVFGCDADSDKTFNEDNDGQNRACNYLSWTSGCAFADWAGLRPMTELEFEKACRGPVPPVANEYAWGSTNFTATTPATAMKNDGTSSETATNGNLNYSGCTPDGPYRVGIYATASSSREEAGASYWGIMDLSGNLAERTVSATLAAGRSFTGVNGDGILSIDGYANQTNWPGYTGAGIRGGDFNGVATLARVADRKMAAALNSGRLLNYGWRAVRSAPAWMEP